MNRTLDVILSAVIKDEQIRAVAMERMDQRHFLPSEQAYMLVFLALKRYYNRHGKIPAKETLLQIVQSTAQSNPAFSGLAPTAASIVDLIYQQEIESDYGMECLQQFLLDREIRRPLAAVVAGEAAPSDSLPEIIKTAEAKLKQIQSLDIRQAPDGAICLSEWSGDILTDPILSGISFVDQNMPTGPKIVNTLLGPSGGGKTILACQILCGCASVQYGQDQLAGKSPSYWFGYFGYEGPVRRPQSIIISHLAKVPRSRLMQVQSFKELSTTASPNQMDIDLFRRGEVSQIMGEQERIEEKRDIIEKYIRVFNFSGADEEHTGRVYGYGGIPEIARLIDAVNNRLGVGVRYVVIDWAGMVVQRYLSKKGNLERAMVLELTSFIDNVYSQIAVPFNCAVLVVHQLRGSLGRSKPTIATKVSHADASWCSNFAVNAWYAFCISYKEEENNLCVVTWTKTRDQRTPPPVVCQIDGELSKFIPMDDIYQIDYSIGKVVPREHVQRSKPTIRVMSF